MNRATTLPIISNIPYSLRTSFLISSPNLDSSKYSPITPIIDDTIEIIRNQQKYYKIVYETIRDLFFKDLLIGKQPKPQQWIIDKIQSINKLYEKKTKKQKTLLDFTNTK